MDIASDMAAIQARIAAILGTGGSPGPVTGNAGPVPGSPAFGAYLAELMAPQSAVQPAQAPMVMPVTGEVTSEFGERGNPMGSGSEFHPGVDIAAQEGTPIAAAMAGRVVAVGRDGGYGNLITVDDGNGLTTRYGHCSEIFARVGQLVSPGDVIGAVGMTGRATGPHLHFEVRQDDAPVDPRRYLPIP